MSFPLEKILTISAREYADISGKPLSDYTAVGVLQDIVRADVRADIHERFASKVPKVAEIVVAYRVQLTDNWALAEGTALVRKS